MRIPSLPEVRKAVAAASAAAAVAVTAGLITGSVAVWVTGGLSVLAAALATYASPPNAAPPGGKHEAAE